MRTSQFLQLLSVGYLTHGDIGCRLEQLVDSVKASPRNLPVDEGLVESWFACAHSAKLRVADEATHTGHELDAQVQRRFGGIAPACQRPDQPIRCDVFVPRSVSDRLSKAILTFPELIEADIPARASSVFDSRQQGTAGHTGSDSGAAPLQVRACRRSRPRSGSEPTGS